MVSEAAKTDVTAHTKQQRGYMHGFLAMTNQDNRHHEHLNDRQVGYLETA